MPYSPTRLKVEIANEQGIQDQIVKFSRALGGNNTGEEISPNGNAVLIFDFNSMDVAKNSAQLISKQKGVIRIEGGQK